MTLLIPPGKGPFPVVICQWKRGGYDWVQAAVRRGYIGVRYRATEPAYNQGGHGVAEAVDEEPDFISRRATTPRIEYRGSSFDKGKFEIDRTLMEVYNFDFDQNKMLCDDMNIDDCKVLQINSTDNYVRYHLVSLMEKSGPIRMPSR